MQPGRIEREERVKEVYERLAESVRGVIIGKDRVVDLCLVALLAGGHVLLTDVPGVGKTTLAKAIALSVAAEFSRVQFTPDLLPSDITGTSIYDLREARFRWLPGPVFAPVLLADEINRATPRTQRALLEAMAEGQVTVEGETRGLPEPFFVIGTQNPHQFYGTYPLPEGQLDRFMVATTMGYPERGAELGMLRSTTNERQRDHAKDDDKRRERRSYPSPRGVPGEGRPTGRRARAALQRRDPEQLRQAARRRVGRDLRRPSPGWIRGPDESRKALRRRFGSKVQHLRARDRSKAS